MKAPRFPGSPVPRLLAAVPAGLRGTGEPGSSFSRRDFLRTGCTALTAAAVSAGLDRFGLVSALADTTAADYKALVCIFLSGGNDGNNTVVPLDAGYAAYASARGASLALPQAQLRPITPSSLGTRFGLHPSLVNLHELWSRRKVAIATNVGALVQPLTREQYRAGAPRPWQLFSHPDQQQQWQTSRADTRSTSGWGGLLADRTGALVTSVAGTAMFAQGVEAPSLTIAPAPAPLPQVLALNGVDANTRKAMDEIRALDRGPLLVAAGQDVMSRALAFDEKLSSDPQLDTPFPSSTLGHQLLQVAKLMKLNQTEPRLRLSRQIFFCELGDFDTHQGQPSRQAALLAELDLAMRSFYEATVELGISAGVITFTLSDFGRTLQPSGAGASVGSDHGWGNHLLVMGDAVRGGDFYGVPTANGSVFPTLQLGGVDDADSRGRWIPTAAVEQYAATLALWFGLPPADLPRVFPLIGRFTTPNLQFLS